MKILDREVLKQLLPSFVFAVAVLVFVLLMDRLFLLADLLVRKGVSVKIVGEIALLSLPFVISISTPLGTLIGSVMTFGRMSQDNEMIAIRAAGIPAWRIFIPALILGSLLMAFMVIFNGFFLPESQHRVRNLLTDIARKKPALRIQERVFLDDFTGYMVYIGAMDEKHSTVSNVIIFEQTRDNKSSPGFITAPRGSIGYTPDDRYMTFTLYNGEIHELTANGNYRRLLFQRYVINILNDENLIRRSREYRSDDELTMPQLISAIFDKKREKVKLKFQLDSLSISERGGEVTEFRKEEFKTKLRYKNLELARSLTELQKRLSLAFSAVFFLMFGAPLGVVLRRGGIGIGFVVGLIFFAVYYILLLGGENFAESGRLTPFMGMWLPNILLILPVAELIARAFFEFSLGREIILRLRLTRRTE